MSEPTEEEKAAKLREFFEKARKGVLRHIAEKGGKLSMGEMHEYSMKKYFIQHQRFSQMMETFVDENLIDYDPGTGIATLTAKGNEFIK